MDHSNQHLKHRASSQAYSYSNTPTFHDDRKRTAKSYKPAATRPWTFVAILMLVATYIALLEVLLSMQIHGSTQKPRSRRAAWIKRQNGSSTAPTVVATTTPPAQLTISVTATPIPDSQLTITTPVNSVTTAAAQLTISTPSISSIGTGVPLSQSQLTLTTEPPAQLSLTSPSSTPFPITTVTTSQIWMTTPYSTSQLSLTVPTPGEPNTASQLSITVPDSTRHFQPTTLVNPGLSTLTPSLSPASTSQLSIVTVTTSTAAPTSTFVLGESHVLIGKSFTKLDYFLSLYLPTLLAVLFQTMWSIVFAATKMMEPFHQLAKSNGALARDSILCEYLSPLMSTASLQAIFAGHWAMLLASVTYLAAGLLAPLASESMAVEPTAMCPTSTIGVKQPCAPVWIVYLPAARALESVLGFTFVCIFLLGILNLRRSSGVYEDPSSIRSMAGLLGEPNVLRDLQAIHPNATKSEVRRALAGNRYKLGYYENATGTHHHYGLIKLNRNEWQEPLSQYGYTAVENPEQKSSKKSTSGRSKPISLFLDVLLILLTLTLFSLILAYYLEGGSDPLNNFFNSGTFGPRFLLSSLAVLISGGWKRVERESRIMCTYRNLSSTSSSQPAKTTVDVTMTGTPLTTIFLALRRGDFFVSWVALIAVFSDILIIAVATIPFSRGQIREAEIAAFYISFAIMGLMMLTLIAVFIRRRWDPKMPRSPDTLAFVWLYLCASDMVVRRGVDGRPMTMRTTTTTEEETDDGKRYWFGLSRGTDGKERWMVDEDRHGVAEALTQRDHVREPDIFPHAF